MKKSLKEATQLELMAAYAQKCKKLDKKDSNFTFRLIDDKTFQIQYPEYGPEKYNINAHIISEKRTLKEAARLELLAMLAKNMVDRKVIVDASAFDFIKVDDEEFQLADEGCMPTNYLINDFLH